MVKLTFFLETPIKPCILTVFYVKITEEFANRNNSRKYKYRKHYICIGFIPFSKNYDPKPILSARAEQCLNSTALRKTGIVYNFGLSECNRFITKVTAHM